MVVLLLHTTTVIIVWLTDNLTEYNLSANHPYRRALKSSSLSVTNPYIVNSVLFILAPTLTSTFGSFTHRLVLTDCKTYGYVVYMLSRDTRVSTYSPLRNTVHTCTVYCTDLNRTYSWGLFHPAPHTDIVSIS